MAAQSSSSFLQKKLDRRAKDRLNIPIGLSKSFVDEGNKLGFVLKKKKKDSTRILGSEMISVTQDHKRRCLEKLMTHQNVEDAKCALEVEVIDDTALIETTGSVTRFKNRHRNVTDLGCVKNSGNTKDENGGKKKRNKGLKKQEIRCSMKCLNEKKPNFHVVEDKSTSEKLIPKNKSQNPYRKIPAAVKYVYQKKDTKKDENQIVNDVSLKMDEKESETVNDKDDGLNLNPKIEDQNVCESTKVEPKKIAYTREEMEVLRFVDEPGQKTKWTDVCNGFAPSVDREYIGLVVDANIRSTQRYNRVVNCGYGSGSNRHANPILGMPPVISLCSPSNNRRFDRVGSGVSFN